jgi:hypothetical protein
MQVLRSAKAAMAWPLHKLVREAQRMRQNEDSPSQVQNVSPGGSENGLEAPGVTRPSVSVSGTDFSPTTQQPKGTLKSPTIRFEDNGNPFAIPMFLPPLPPMLYNSMQPLPPGPPTALDMWAPAPNGSTQVNPASVSLYTRFMDELAEFVAMQGDVIRFRVHVQEKRRKVKIYRENVSKCDMKFINCLRESKANGSLSTDPELERLYDASQEARDEVGPEEDDYEKLELRLGADEFALKEKYDSLESRFENFFKLRATSTTNKSAPASINFESSSAASDIDENHLIAEEPKQFGLFQGAVIGDKVKVGQLPFIEPYGTTITPSCSQKKAPLSGLQGPSRSSGLGRRESSNVKNTPVNEKARITDGLAGVKHEVGEWMAPEYESCEARMDFNLKGLQDVSMIRESSGGLDDLNVENLFGDGNSLLLLGSDTDTQSTLSDYLMQFDSTRNRVNRWLLHKLRISPLEISELRRQVLKSPQSTPNWADLALDCWDKDNTEDEPEHSPSGLEDPPGPYPGTRDFPTSPTQGPRYTDGTNIVANIISSSDEKGSLNFFHRVGSSHLMRD